LSIHHNNNIQEQKKRTLLFVFSVVLCFLIALVLNRSDQIRYQSDLFARWYAARQLIETGRNLYDIQNGMDVVEYKSLHTTPLEANFFYPAYLLVFVAPLAIINFSSSHLIWTFLVLLFLVLGIWILTTLLKWPPTINQLTAFLLASIFFIPTLQNAIWSQFDSIAVICLALCYLALCKGRFGIAGAWASGLIFKPQGALLVLILLLLWAILVRERWRFILGFLLSSFLLWGIAQLLQPGWVHDFLNAFSEYQKLPYDIKSVLDTVWNPYQVFAIILVIITLLVVYNQKESSPYDGAFRASITMGFSVWWLIVPVIGMLQLVLMPIAVIYLLSTLIQTNMKIYRYALGIFALIYISGYLGFIYGVINPNFYGSHIDFVEVVYKLIAPIFLIAFSLPLAIRKINNGALHDR
jgi:hypothetical protein